MLLLKVPVWSHTGLSRGPNLNSFFSLQVPQVPVCVLRAHIAVAFLCRVGKFGNATGTGTKWDQEQRPSFCFRPTGSNLWFWFLILIAVLFAFLKGGFHAH